MTAIELRPVTQDIVVDEVLPHAPETIWKALTSSALIARWIMEPSGFAPVEGTSFTFRTTPAGAWDGSGCWVAADESLACCRVLRGRSSRSGRLPA